MRGWILSQHALGRKEGSKMDRPLPVDKRQNRSNISVLNWTEINSSRLLIADKVPRLSVRWHRHLSNLHPKMLRSGNMADRRLRHYLCCFHPNFHPRLWEHTLSRVDSHWNWTPLPPPCATLAVKQQHPFSIGSTVDAREWGSIPTRGPHTCSSKNARSQGTLDESALEMAAVGNENISKNSH